ncbi:MAG: molybdopterin converting factor subunit 1 [Endozoicomonas sp.]
MINVLFFASYREKLGCESLQLQEHPTSLSALRTLLAGRGQAWQEVMDDQRVLVALNQAMTRRDAALNDGDEVAFFPPVTGG